MGRRGQSITLSISDQDKTELEQIAAQQGMLWGERPNISRLVEAIARRKLLVGHNHNWSDDRLRALLQAIDLLVDAGQMAAAQTISDLVIERSETNHPLRQKLSDQFATPTPSWRQTLDHHIRTQQPYQLAYQDAAGRIFSFNICHAEINWHERRQYLDCWCEQTAGNQDIPALQHNWCLRLDRITDAAISPISHQWRPQLDSIDVEFHLLGGLAFAYNARPTDHHCHWHPDLPQTRQVIRRVSSSFWFLREILPYCEDCLLISPPELRTLLHNKLQAMSHAYSEVSPQQP
jgi:predicted DNA-binding transcriptional regulator YafY